MDEPRGWAEKLLHVAFALAAVVWLLAGIGAVIWYNRNFDGPAPPESQIPI